MANQILDNVMDRLKRALNPQTGASFDGDHMLSTTQVTLMAGEDTSVGVVKTEQRFGYTFMSLGAAAATANNIKSGAAFLHAIINNQPQAAQTILVMDSTASSATSIFSALLFASSGPPQTTFYDVSLANGLTVVTPSVAGGHNLTAVWR